jgi:hypothetical protein
MVKVAFRVGEMKELCVKGDREGGRGERRERDGKPEGKGRRTGIDVKRNDGDRKGGTATRDAPATSRRRRDRMRNFDALVLGIRRQETRNNPSRNVRRALLARANFAGIQGN